MIPRIAIIGAGGFVGARMVEYGILTGRYIPVPIIRAPKSAARLGRFGPIWHCADALNVEDLAASLQGCDAAVNLTVGDLSRMAELATTVWEACARSAVATLVHMSTAEVFGRVESEAIDDDSDPPPNHWMPYARAKIEAEQRLRPCFGKHDVACVVLRPGLIWGPQSPWVVNPLRAMLDGTAFLIGSGEGICNLIHVDNLIQRILAVVSHSSPTSGFYNVADKEVSTWKTYYHALAEQVGMPIASIHTLPEGPYRNRKTFRAHVANISRSLPARLLKRCLSPEVKQALTAALASLKPAPAFDGPLPRRLPQVQQADWHLQHVRRKLPTVKFGAAFGGCEDVPFEIAIQRVGAWARWAGFASPSDSLPG